MCVCVCVYIYQSVCVLNGPCSLSLPAGLILFSIQCNALLIYPRHFAIFLFCWCIVYRHVACSDCDGLQKMIKVYVICDPVSNTLKQQ